MLKLGRDGSGIVQNMFKNYFLSLGHPVGVFLFSQKKCISGFWGHARFEEIAFLINFDHIWSIFRQIDAPLQRDAKVAIIFQFPMSF